MSKNQDMSRVSAKDDDPVRKLCIRFNRDYKQTRDFKDAVTYLQLRGSGCPRKDAILFAAKNNCRVDTTKVIDGPKEYRNLKIQQVPSYMISEGWLYGQQDYNLGSCFPSRYSSTFLDHQNNHKLEENFDEQEIQMRKEYKEMIHRMKGYVKQINQKYNFTTGQGDILIDMVRKIVQGMKAELENRQYFVMNNVRYYDAAEAIVKKRMLSEEEKNILTEKLNVFNNFENDEDFQQVQIIKVNDEDQNTEDNSPMKNPFFIGMFNNSLQRGSTTYNKNGQLKQSQFGQNSNPTPTISYAHQLKNLECATHLLEEFEKGEGEDLPNGPHGKFDRSYASKKKKRQEQMKQNLHLVREENQAGLEGQFNQQKYFFSKDEKQNLNLRKEQQEKEDFQNIIFDIYRTDDEDGYFRYINSVNEINQQDNLMMQHSQSSIQIGQGKNRKQSLDSQQPELINMDIIKQMKQRQDIYQEHFRNKISTSNALQRKKLVQIQPHKMIPLRNSISSNINRQQYQQPITQSNKQSSNMANRSNTSTQQISPNGTYNMLTNNNSLTNLSSRNKNNLILMQKASFTPSASTAARLTPLQTSHHLNYNLGTHITSANSFNRLNFPSANKNIIKKQSSRQSAKTQASKGEYQQEQFGRRLIQQQVSNSNQEVLPLNRTVTWFGKGQQAQPISSKNQNKTEKNQNNGKSNCPSRNNSSSILKLRNSSLVSSPSQGSPANKLAQQYYYQGVNPIGSAEKTNKEKLFLSSAINEKKQSSKIAATGCGFTAQTNNTTRQENENQENNSQSIQNSQQQQNQISNI